MRWQCETTQEINQETERVSVSVSISTEELDADRRKRVLFENHTQKIRGQKNFGQI